MEFSKWLQAELNNRGWGQSDLARRSGLSTSQISNVLNGGRDAGPDFCIGVARALGISREEVFRQRGWLLREPTLVVPADADTRLTDLAETVRQLNQDLRDLILDGWEMVLHVAGIELNDLPGPNQSVVRQRQQIRSALQMSKILSVLKTDEERELHLRDFKEHEPNAFNILLEWSREPKESRVETKWNYLLEKVQSAA